MYQRLFLLPLFALLLLFAVNSGNAQSASSITGRVQTADGTPISGAAVEILGTSPRLGSYARRDGSYRIRTVRPGRYALRISAPGHFDDTINVTVEAGRDASLELLLVAAPVPDRREFDGYEGAGLSMDDGGGRDGGILMRGGRATESRVAMKSMSAGAAASESGSGGSAAPPPPMGAPVEAMSMSKSPAPEPSHATATTEGRPDVIETPKPDAPERSGQLTAGEWCDLVNWTYWLEVAGSEEWGKMPTYWGFDPSSRITVIATDGERLITDAEVTLSDGQTGKVWRARTDNRGRAELFVGVAGKPAGTYRVEVRSGSATAIVNNVNAPSHGPVIAKLRDAAPTPTTLDLMFVIDCTGSMGDELEYVKSELESVIDRVRENHSDRIAIRMSANFYRDRGDEYVVRSFPFTESSFEAIGQIRDQSADNGGDFPEAVEEALEDGIEKHEWSSSAKARLMFLVLDAPPHYDEARLKTLQTLAKRAAEKGIRIIPVASSGVDKETEFLLRLMAIYSGGTYTFLTDDSGVGNSHMKPSIGKYDVEYLDNLLVRLIGRWVEDVTIDDAMRAALR